MKKVYVDEIRETIKIDKERLARRLYIDTEDHESLLEFEELLEEASTIGRPKACLAKLEVIRLGGNKIQLNGILFESSILTEKIINDSKVYGIVCTCGLELEEWAKKYRQDPLLSYYADNIMAQYLWEASSFIKNELKKEVKGNLSHTSPGSTKDIPIQKQVKLFEAIGDVEGQIGVYLTKDFLMRPLKSVSSIYFLSQDAYADCQACMRLDCPSRKAPYLNS